MPDFGFDDWIDAQLRNVPVPPELLANLSKIGSASPKSATFERNSPERDGLEQNSLEGYGAEQDIRDARVNAILRDVPVPRNLESQLLRIAHFRRPAPPKWQIGLAASVVIAVGVAVFGYVALPDRMPSSGEIAQQVVGVAPEREVAQNLPATPPAESIVSRSSPPDPQDVVDDRAVEAAPAEKTSSQLVGSRQSRPAEPISLPAKESLARVATSVRQAVEAKLRVQAALGAGGHLDRLPDLDVLEVPEFRGIIPPRVRGYDLLFQLKHGEHPFVAPAAHAELATSRVPLTFRTASYDLALRKVREGHLPAADEIRVEDFLAAVDYALPPAPAGGLALQVAGSPSPLKDGGLHLLQFTVQAAVPKPVPHSSKRLILVVDQSISMRKAARWEAIQHALAKIAQQLNEADRVTLIAFAERPTVLATNASREQFQALLSSAALGSPSGLANFSLAIESAREAAGIVKNSKPATVVFLTAGRKDFDEPARAHATQALRALTDAKVAWEIIRVAPGGQDPALAELAEAARGKISDAMSGAEIYDAMSEKLTGRPSLVALAASLKITFDPQIVTGYRLIGHEAVTLTGGSPAPLEVDFHAGQTATGLYELWIKPTGRDVVATAELTWHDPKNNQLRRVARTSDADR